MNLGERLEKHFGGRRPAAEAMDVSTETIRLWVINGIPLERALDVELKSEGIVKAEEVLREARRAQSDAEDPKKLQREVRAT